MKRLLLYGAILVVFAMMVSGCAWGVKAGVKDVVAIDKAISAAVKECEEPGRTSKFMSAECRAGLAAGATISTNAASDVRIAAIDMEANVKKDSPVYKCCRVVSDWVSFIVNGGADVLQRGFAKAVSMGVDIPGVTP